jgi:hypothetical protein
MYFVRTYTGGGADYDPRSKLWSVWQCDVCGEESDIECRPNVDMKFNEARKCPECHSFGKEDHAKQLLVKKNLLEIERERINQEIDKIINEINQIGVEQNVVE